MKIHFTYLVLALLFSFNVKAHNNSNNNQKPIIDTYISILDAQHLTSVRVNIEKSDDPDGKITKTEINFGDGFVSSKDDVIHQYAADGVYTITIKAWDNRNAVSVVTKNIDVASNLIFSDGASIYGPIGIKDNKTYSFNASASQLQNKFKLILTQQPENRYSMYLNKFLNWCYKFLGHNHNDKFEANVELNGIEIFAKNEISKNTLKAEKFVNLQSHNKIKADFDHEHGNKFKIEIKEVSYVKDSTAPAIAINVQSDTEVNTGFIAVNISDISGQVTTDVWKVMPLAQNGPPVSAGTVNQHILTTNASSFNIPLTEGLNSFILRSQDIFGNVSNYYYINNILYDATAPQIVNISPQLDGSFYFYKVPGMQDVLPITKFFDLTASERIASIEIVGATNLNLVFTDVARTKVAGRFTLNNEGISVVQLKLKDYVGNERVYSYSINNVIVTEAIQLTSLNPAVNQTYYTNQHFFNISYQMQSNYPVYSKAFVNSDLKVSTDGASATVSVPLPHEGVNNIDMHFLYAFEPRFAAAIATWNIIKDSAAPTLTSASVQNNEVFYTNQLPKTIPVNLQFSENLTNITVNGISQPTFSNSYSTNYFVNSAGLQQLHILAQDRAGNIASITHQINVQYSNADLILTMNENSLDILTNKISIPLSGVASEKLQSIKMNNQTISIDADGKSFSAVFQAPSDGLHHVVFEGTDIYGNTGTTDTYIRVISTLPDEVNDYKGPTADYDKYKYNIDPGDLFKYGPGGDVCGALDVVFGGVGDIGVQDVADALGHVPKGYTRKIPKVNDVEKFYKKHIDRDPANIVKAGYLMMCHGFDLLAGEDCEQNRDLFKRVMRQYPEPFIIRKFPIPAVVQNFLIRRYNICTGLDTSGLGCKDLLVFAPFIADLALPGLGQLIGSDMGQFVMETLLCKELCDQPQYANTPLCQDVELPKIPDIPDFGGPKFSFPGDGPGSRWGRGGGGSWPGGGGSCGGWPWDDCDDGRGGDDRDNGAGAIVIDYMCSALPNLWLCHPQNPLNDDNIVTIQPIPTCNPSMTLNDIMNMYSPGSPTSAFNNYISSCLDQGVPFVPDNKKPVLTVTAPIQNQLVESNLVRVTGYVSDISAQVKIEGQVVPVISGPNGLHFDIEITVPADLKINVEAIDFWGNFADPVEINLTVPNTSRVHDVKFIQSMGGQTCVIMGTENSLKCWNMSDISALYSYPGLETGVTSLSLGANFSCAVKNGLVYCWGTNAWGEFGYPASVLSSSAIPVQNPYLTDIQKIQVTYSGICALTTAGTVKCAGLSDEGSLGDGFHAEPGYSVYQPVNVAGFDAPVVDLIGSVINSFNCAKQVNNKLFCWGNGSTHLSYVAQRIAGNQLHNATSMSSYYRNLCFVKESKQYCIGYNMPSLPMLPGGVIGDYGSNPELKDFFVFPREMLNISDVKKHVNGGSHMCILQGSGSVKCWGNNAQMQLGNYVGTYTEDLISIENLSQVATDISAGGNYTCVVVGADKKVQCWGAGSSAIIDIN